MTKKILIATGGTGGHIFPAYSLADYFTKKNYKVQVATDRRGYKFLQEFKNLNLKIIPSSPIFKKNIFKLAFSISVIIYSIINPLRSCAPSLIASNHSHNVRGFNHIFCFKLNRMRISALKHF